MVRSVYQNGTASAPPKPPVQNPGSTSTYAVRPLVSYGLNSPAIQLGGRSFECRSATHKRLRNSFSRRALPTRPIFGKHAGEHEPASSAFHANPTYPWIVIHSLWPSEAKPSQRFVGRCGIMPTRNRAEIVAVWWYEPDIEKPLDTSIQGGTRNHSNHVFRRGQPDRAAAIPRTLHNYW